VKFLSGQAAYWKGILVLSVILPISLFTGLKLAGMGQPPNAETITLSPVAWQFNRTSADTLIQDWLNATYADNMCQMSFSVELGAYEPPDSAIPTYKLIIGIGLAVVPLNGDFSVRSVLVTFGEDPQPSQIEVLRTYLSFENLTLTDFSSGEQARVQLLGDGSQGGVHCQFSAFWFLFTPNDVTSQRRVDFEITYFNGTAYKRVIQPFDLTLLGS
jgi:hypothetical protein